LQLIGGDVAVAVVAVLEVVLETKFECVVVEAVLSETDSGVLLLLLLA
jgi:hypothetical protein